MRLKNKVNIYHCILKGIALVSVFLTNAGCVQKMDIEILNVPNLVLYEDFGSIEINLDSVFYDPLDSPMTYETTTSDLLEISVNDDIATLSLFTPKIFLEEVTIIAKNDRDQVAFADISISTIPSLSYRIKGDWNRDSSYNFTQISFFDSTFRLVVFWDSPDGQYFGDYKVDNETWVCSWDLGPDRIVEVVDTNINRMKFNGVNWLRKEQLKNWP